MLGKVRDLLLRGRAERERRARVREVDLLLDGLDLLPLLGRELRHLPRDGLRQGGGRLRWRCLRRVPALCLHQILEIDLCHTFSSRLPSQQGR